MECVKTYRGHRLQTSFTQVFRNLFLDTNASIPEEYVEK
jgi:hypothetical protein